MKSNGYVRSFVVFMIPVVGLGFFLAFNPRSTLNARENPYGETTKYSEKFDELKTEIIKEGEGDILVEEGDTLSVQYKGWLSKNGKVFDQSANDYTFMVGEGVIEGWSQGVIGMKKGEIRKLLIPSGLAYKESGSGEAIPPNADLVFVIELIDIVPGVSEEISESNL